MALFKTNKYTRFEDKIWLNKALKYKGISEEIKQVLNKFSLVLVVVHFKDTLHELQKAFNENRVYYRVLSNSWEIFAPIIQELSNENIRAVILMSQLLPDIKMSNDFKVVKPEKKKEYYFLITEHYPIDEKDNLTMSFVNELPFKSSLCFHVSLDEPLMKSYVNADFIKLMKNLGWDEDKNISHPMLTRSIEKIQKSVKGYATGDQKVNSMEDWFRYNCPGLIDKNYT
ncbi:hypothetical protein JXI42_04790 [bacterium]|nr:hypothetical protein [bacterium]